jgi:hypothetical protein
MWKAFCSRLGLLILPILAGRRRILARAAVSRIRERAEQHKFGRFNWSEWKSYRDEGRP